MTPLQIKNLMRLLLADNEQSRNLGQLLLEKSTLSEQEKQNILNKCGIIKINGRYFYFKPLKLIGFS